MSFVTGHDPFVVLYPGVKELNLPTPDVAAQLTAVLCLWLHASPPVRGDQFGTELVSQELVVRIAVIRFVGYQDFWSRFGKSAGKRCFSQGDFVS